MYWCISFRWNITNQMKTISWILVLLFCIPTLFADKTEERRIWPEEYVKPAQTQPQKQQQKRPAKKPAYKIATPAVVVNTVQDASVVGVTIWRLRPALETEKAAVIVDPQGKKWIPERVEADTVLSSGDRVRLGIEAARDGYLYIINREQYKDGTRSEPYLIFPTSRLSDGNPHTSVGRIVEIPSQDDQPPFFTLSPGRSDQVAEIISILITPEPMNYLPISEKPLQLSADQVAQWEQAWGKEIGRLEMVDGAGQTWTEAEKEAGTGARLLKHEDPPPQSVYYNPTLKESDPTFLSINLRYETVAQ